MIISPTLSLKEAMLCWNIDSAEVEVVPWPDTSGLSAPYQMTGLAAWRHVRELEGAEATAKVFVEAVHLIVRDRCEPLAVHRAMLRIKEYWVACAGDMPHVDRPNDSWL